MQLQQPKWFDRKFDFSSNENIFPSIIERLRGTPARLEEKIQNTPEKILVDKIDKSWSIKENVGHLIDLETSWMGRLEDILNRETFLRTADLQNTQTERANHNSTSIKDLLHTFREIRLKTVERIINLSEEEIFLSGLHPRLKTPMRTMDHFLFVAEHDDHHLVAIQNILTYHSK
jgi:uncharacterized damage-inducible protein DinB